MEGARKDRGGDRGVSQERAEGSRRGGEKRIGLEGAREDRGGDRGVGQERAEGSRRLNRKGIGLSGRKIRCTARECGKLEGTHCGLCAIKEIGTQRGTDKCRECNRSGREEGTNKGRALRSVLPVESEGANGGAGHGTEEGFSDLKRTDGGSRVYGDIVDIQVIALKTRCNNRSGADMIGAKNEGTNRTLAFKEACRNTYTSPTR